MSLERVIKLLQQKEGILLEFKEAKTDLPSNLFESICAMLNRDGGDILLGIDDNGKIIGIDDSKLETIKTNLVNLSNNPEKLDPPFILFPQVHELEGNSIIHIPISVSSQVHKTKNTIYDRSNDGDFKVTDPEQVAQIVLNKRNHYSEVKVFPTIKFSEFKPGIFQKVKALIRSNNPRHPWLQLDDEEMLKKAGLWRTDRNNSQQGYTLAAVLLFGTDELIQEILPYYKIDAILRKRDITRYDDRDYIQCNLIDAYDRLMNFIDKHLPDNFYMEGDQRKSLRTKIFREIAANIIVHREYTNASPTTLVIYKDRVETQNANNANGEGLLLPDKFTPFPKNPLIAKFFVQLGHVDELGSGILNVNRLINNYAPGRKPQFIEGKVFKTIIPVGEETPYETAAFVGDKKIEKNLPSQNDRINDRLNDKINDRIKEGVDTEVIDAQSKGVIENLVRLTSLIYQTPLLNADELAVKINVSTPTVNRYLKILKQLNISESQGARKTGGYKLTAEFIKQLNL